MAKAKSRVLTTSVFMSVDSLRKEMKTALLKQKLMTESVLWHSIRFSNVAMFEGFDRASVSVFDAKLRELIPVKWSKDDSKYVFDAEKAAKTKGLLSGYHEEITDFEFQALIKEYKKPVAQKSDDEKRDSAKKQAATLVKRFKELGLTKEELRQIIDANF